jgi:hypothetical protein
MKAGCIGREALESGIQRIYQIKPITQNCGVLIGCSWTDLRVADIKRTDNKYFNPVKSVIDNLNSFSGVSSYRVVNKSLARPISRCILFDGENISFDASLVLYI